MEEPLTRVGKLGRATSVGIAVRVGLVDSSRVVCGAVVGTTANVGAARGSESVVVPERCTPNATINVVTNTPINTNDQ